MIYGCVAVNHSGTHDLVSPPKALMAKMSIYDSLQRVEKKRNGQNVEKPRKGKFLCSLFKSCPSHQVLRTCLDLPPGSPAEPPASPWPSPSLCCWPWGCSAPVPRALWAASCLRAACEQRQSGQLHTLESDGKSVHHVLSEGQD